MTMQDRAGLLGPMRRLERKDAGGDSVSSPELKNAIDSLARTFEAFKAKNDEHLKELGKKTDDVVTREHVDRINAAIDAELKKRDDEILELKRQRILGAGSTGGEALSPELAEYKAAFDVYLRKGDSYMPAPRLQELAGKANEVKALATNSEADGGFTVIPQFDQNLREIQLLVSPIRALAQVQAISTNALRFPANLRGTAASWAGETDLRTTATATSRLADVEIVPGELIAVPSATQQMLEDSFINVESWIQSEAALAFAVAEGKAFINGDGSKKPRGFLTYNIVADASWSWGSIGYVPTGASAGFLSPQIGPPVVQGADVFFDLIGVLKPGYRGNAQFLANRRTIAQMRKLKTVYADYLWAPGLNGGQVDSFCGYPLAQAEDMPDVAASSYSIGFGDWRSFYLIVDRVGTSVLRDPYTQTPYVLFKTRKRVGGGIQNFEAVKLLKFSVS